MIRPTWTVGLCVLALMPARVALSRGGIHSCETSLASCNADLSTCSTDLSSCNSNLMTCDADLSTCSTDLSTCNTDLTTCDDALAVAQACGNGVIDSGEQCDFGNLNGESCASQTPATPYGKLACKASCVFDTSGCAGRFVDNGDGTVTDNQTKLLWEKKTNLDGVENPADPHDADNGYAWSGVNGDGNVFTDFLSSLNAGAWDGVGIESCSSPDGVTMSNCPVATCQNGFAGHCDWRLPTLAELQGIVELDAPGCRNFSPCIDPVFGATIVSFDAGTSYLPHYWSSTSSQSDSSAAFSVLFDDGSTHSGDKIFDDRVRAVRDN